MDYLLKKYLPQIEFSSYEEFREKLDIRVPEDFNFGFDVVDAFAGSCDEHEPDPAARAEYDAIFKRYASLTRALGEWSHGA